MRADKCIHKTAESTNESKQFYIKKNSWNYQREQIIVYTKRMNLPMRVNKSIKAINWIYQWEELHLPMKTTKLSMKTNSSTNETNRIYHWSQITNESK